MSDAPLFHELSPPPDAQELGGHEVLRASIVEGAVSVALRRSFDDPATWGTLLADLARQVARVYALETDVSAQDALDDIKAGLEAEFARAANGDPSQSIN